MSKQSSTLAVPLLTLAAALSPLAAQAAAPAGEQLKPAVMHFQVAYNPANDAPSAVEAYVQKALSDLDEVSLPKIGCKTVSGSGYGWDDSDYGGPGC